MFNCQLENNPEQHAAVQRIVAGSSKPAPHLVFGPPGTGKTITLVEAMHQVSSVQDVLLLVCSLTLKTNEQPSSICNGAIILGLDSDKTTFDDQTIS